jgi:gliding motility-associated-like protein
MTKFYYDIVFIVLSFSFVARGQQNYYLITDNSDLIFVDQNNCYDSTICNCGTYIQDIALTPNGKIYASTGKKILEINTSDCSNTVITPIPVTDTISNGGHWINSLVALNNQYLFAASTDAILYKIDLISGTSYKIDTLTEFINGNQNWYSSGGDLTWYKGKMLLVTAMNELVQIEMDISFENLIKVQKIGTIVTPYESIYGVLTIGGVDCTVDDLKILGFEGQDVYEINPLNAESQIVCDSLFFGNVYGATSLSEVQNQIVSSSAIFPNVFTPNRDGINDKFYPIEIVGVDQYEFTIINRWGNKVYYVKDEPISWDGLNSELNISEGVYYYVIEGTDYCGDQFKQTGFITLIR